MTTRVPRLPAEVHDYVRGIFEQCNARVSGKMARIPTVHETSLDLSLIESISHFASPHRVGEDWTVRLDTHYLGGGRHFGEWEVADVGFIIVWRDKGKVRLRKVAVLQSKRLYPDEQGLEEDTPLDYMIGFARLMQGDEEDLAAQEERLFSFSNDSRYRTLSVGNHQYIAITEYEKRYKIPVHYLLYQPLTIPSKQRIPIIPTSRKLGTNAVGAEVLRATTLRASLGQRPKGYSPTYSDLAPLKRWRLEGFVADELLRCREGYRASGPDDEGLFQVFNRRAGPIAAAIAITIDRV